MSPAAPTPAAPLPRLRAALRAEPRRWWTALLALVVAAAALVALLGPRPVTGDRSRTWQAAGSRQRLEPVIAAPEGAGRADALADLRALRVASESIALLRQRYVEPQKFRARAMIEEALQSVAHLIPEMLVDTTRSGPDDEPLDLRVRIGEASLPLRLEGADGLLDVGWHLLTALRFVAQHLPPDVAAAKVEYAAVNGLLSTLDPYSRLLDPDQWRDMQTSTGGNFGGLGIVIVPADGALVVQQVLPDSPALRVGLQTGDRILQIDGEETAGMSVDHAVERLRGEVGTRARLLVQRKGWAQPQSVDVIRAVIHLQSVEAKVLDNGVAYARIKQFQRGTAGELGEAIDRLLAEGAERLLVLDLRDNPGGLLDEAIRVCDLFVAQGPAVTTVSGAGTQRDVRNVTGNGRFVEVPLVVLLSAHSASASEVVAGALKFSGRAVVLGEQSFGKGSVQVPFEVGDGALKLTVAKYLVPGDRSIHGTGITPDIGLQFVSATREQVNLYSGPRSARVVGRRGPPAQQPPQPPLTMRVLLPDASVPAKGDQTVTETPADVMEREPRQRAALLLRRAGRVRAADTLAAAADDLRELAEADDAALVEHLRAQGVDWRKGPAVADARRGLRVEIAGGAAGLQAQAGEVLRMSVTVTNAGTQPAARLHVLTRCDDPNLDGHEQLVGRLDPGQSRTVHLAIRVSVRHADLAVPLQLALVQDGTLLGSRDEAVLTVHARPLPQLAVRWRLDDADAAQPAAGGQVADHGKPDGVLQPGERAALRVEIRNDGPGLAQVGYLVARAPRGLLKLGEPRVRLGTLAPGATTVVRLPLSVAALQDQPTASPQAGPQAGPQTGPQAGPQTGPQAGPQAGPQTGPQTGPQRLPLELILGDELLATERSEWLALPYLPQGTLPSSERDAWRAEAERWHEPPQIAVGTPSGDWEAGAGSGFGSGSGPGSGSGSGSESGSGSGSGSRETQLTRSLTPAASRRAFGSGSGSGSDALLLPLPPLSGSCALTLHGSARFGDALPWRRFVTVSVAGVKRFYQAGHGQPNVRFAAPLRFQPGLTTITIAAQAGPRQGAERAVLVHCSSL